MAAETLRSEGFDGRVVLIGEEAQRPYERPLLSKEYLRGDKPAARLYVHEQGFYADNDIELLTGTRVASLDPGGHEITLADGSRMPYSRLLLSTGALPRRLPLPGTELPGVRYLRSMGDADALRAAIGAAVVDGFRRTSAPDIFAAGDVAATWNPMYNKHIRMEHWANALNQGPAAARNMLGQHTAYAKLPYFYSDQYDLGMEYHGYADDWDRVVLRGDLAGREFLAFWLKDGRVLAGMNANLWDLGEDIKALVRSGAIIDADRLGDPSTSLADATFRA